LIEAVTKAPIKYVIYSHSHFDHIAGGKPFKDLGATFVAHFAQRLRCRFHGVSARVLPWLLADADNRALPAGAAIEALELSDTLKSKTLRLEDFESAEPPEDIPLDEVARQSPGPFTCMFETFIWSPPAGADISKDRIELLGRDGELLSTGMRRLSDSGHGGVHFQLLGKERTALARVRRRDGTLSAPAIVLRLDELREAVPDARDRRIDAALEQLDGKIDLGLWLLETLNKLEAAETA
jgi:hypothetical protein